MKFSLFKEQKQPKTPTVSVIMEDGSIQIFPENFHTDENSCVVCGTMYHTHFDCPTFRINRQAHQVKAMTRHQAEHDCLEYCWRCHEYDRMEEQ